VRSAALTVCLLTSNRLERSDSDGRIVPTG
jgi:hypothetical protein